MQEISENNENDVSNEILLVNENDDSNEVIQKPGAKKRGRKPKGGKIIQQTINFYKNQIESNRKYG